MNGKTMLVWIKYNIRVGIESDKLDGLKRRIRSIQEISMP